jgi:hypothetical protein
MEWRCDSNVRVPAFQARSPEFKPQSYQKTNKKEYLQSCWVHWYTPIIAEPGRLRQKDQEFQASLDNIVRPCLKTKLSFG